MSRLTEIEERLPTLALAKLVVTHWGYLRPDARDASLSGDWFKQADEVLNPIFGSAEEAHRQIIAALHHDPGEEARIRKFDEEFVPNCDTEGL